MTLPKLTDVPVAAAYLVCHDYMDRGAMEVWPEVDLPTATAKAAKLQSHVDGMGMDGCGWRAYAKLPRVRVWKVYQHSHTSAPVCAYCANGDHEVRLSPSADPCACVCHKGGKL